MTTSEPDEHPVTKWRLDKTFPVAVIWTIIIGLAGQGAIAVWWAATETGAISALVSDATKLAGRVTALEADRTAIAAALGQADRITRLETDRAATNATIAAIQTMVARIDERTAYLADQVRRSK